MILRVFRPIGVKKINCVAADIDAPGVKINVAQFNLHRANQRLSFGIQHRFQRQVYRVQERVILRLPIVLVDLLAEIAFAIKQADSDKANAQVAG